MSPEAKITCISSTNSHSAPVYRGRGPSATTVGIALAEHPSALVQEIPRSKDIILKFGLA